MSLYRTPSPAPAQTRCASTRCNRPVTRPAAYCSEYCADEAELDAIDAELDTIHERGTPPPGAVNILIVFVAACVMVGLVIAWGMGVWGS